MQLKPYMVGIVAEEPNFDALPVAKITNYPLEPRDYKPFAQSILCVGMDRLYLRMWAFEVSPAPTSTLACVIYPNPTRRELAVCLRIEHGEGDRVDTSVLLLENGRAVELDAALQDELKHLTERHPHNGEDLQGVYWGETLALPLDLLERLVEQRHAFRPGIEMPGNFYKLCADKRFAHQGSLFPARFPDAPFGLESMGCFRIVNY